MSEGNSKEKLVDLVKSYREEEPKFQKVYTFLIGMGKYGFEF